MKSNVVTCRVSDDILASLDALVDSGIYPTRSEAVIALLQVGLDVNREMVERARSAASEIKRLREEARANALTLASAREKPIQQDPKVESPNER